MFVTDEDLSLYVRIHGDGIPVICIHPPLLTGETFRMQWLQLDQQMLWIVPDLRGHGHSQHADPSIRTDYQQIATDLIGLHQRLHLKPSVICGYSTGGGLVIELLHRAPERFIGGIIISGMVRVADDKLAKQIKIARWLSQYRSTRAALLTRTCVLNSAMPSMALDLFQSGMQSNARAIRDYYSSSLIYDGSMKLPHVRQPVLLAYGQKDTDFHMYADELMIGLQQAERTFIAGMGHQLPSKAFDQLNQAITQWMHRFVL